MNRTKQLMMSLFAVAVLGLSATAQAQDTPPPSEPPPPPPTTTRSSSSGGDGAGIGVGAGVTLTGGTFGQFVYDQAIWHLEGLLTFQSNSAGGERQTVVGFGAGGWYHLHRGSSSDFSLGGALTVNTTSGPGDGSTTVTALEPGAQIRAFITPNVALGARVGLALRFGDTPGGGTDVLLLGQAQAAFGITYFFR